MYPGFMTTPNSSSAQAFQELALKLKTIESYSRYRDLLAATLRLESKSGYAAGFSCRSNKYLTTIDEKITRKGPGYLRIKIFRRHQL